MDDAARSERGAANWFPSCSAPTMDRTLYATSCHRLVFPQNQICRHAAHPSLRTAKHPQPPKSPVLRIRHGWPNDHADGGTATLSRLASGANSRRSPRKPKCHHVALTKQASCMSESVTWWHSRATRTIVSWHHRASSCPAGVICGLARRVRQRREQVALSAISWRSVAVASRRVPVGFRRLRCRSRHFPGR